MTSKITISNISELLETKGIKGYKSKEACTFMLCSTQVKAWFSTPVYLDSNFTILVLSGKSVVRINYKEYLQESPAIIALSTAHLFEIHQCSENLQLYCLYISKAFMAEMDPTEIIYVRTRYGVKIFNKPIIKLAHVEAERLQKRLQNVTDSISEIGHLYHKQMILNTIIAFFLDLSNYLEKHINELNNSTLTQHEYVVKNFIELLAMHYQAEHHVDFYADQLHISAHYLTQIVKQTTGQSACNLIYEMLYSEARTLLDQSKLSVQQIADRLNFSDQSSFGKFFKRKATYSPLEYRRKKN